MYQQIKLLREKHQRAVINCFKEMIPHIEQSYDLLVKENAKYDLSVSKMDNLYHNLYTDGDLYAGIVEGCNKGKMIMENAQFVLLFNEVETKELDKGVRIFQVYEELDKDCIENAWGYKTTEKWMRGLDVAMTMTDVTSESQIIDGRAVCHRPTIQRLIEDLNINAFQHYPVIIDEAGYFKTTLDFGLVEYAVLSFSMVAERLGTGIQTF